MKLKSLAVQSIVMFMLSSLVKAGSIWPDIASSVHSMTLTASSDHHNIYIVGKDGANKYCLTCYLNGWNVDSDDFDYSGDFECRLVALYGHDSFSTLFADIPHPTRDWQGRGRFLVEELDPSNPLSKVPEYGSVRTYHLRMMALRISVKSLNRSGSMKNPRGLDAISRLVADVEVAPDPNALSSHAEKPKEACPAPCEH